MSRVAVQTVGVGRHASSLRGVVGACLELAKARLSALVVLTTLTGYLLAARGAIDGLHLAVTLIGTTLAAWSANALNQWLEADRDARMIRTQGRPIPSGRIAPGTAVGFAAACGIIGVGLLLAAVNAMAAGLAAITIAIYVLLYTPLKVRTSLNTAVGAVCGAIPPMIGWAAAAGSLEIGAWVLAALLFVWQMPHFLALAWMYREDYARGGYRMLPAIDATGRLTAAASLLYGLALMPVAVAMTFIGVNGSASAIAGIALGAWVAYLALRFCMDRQNGIARRLFLASVIYLPLIMLVMVLDRAAAIGGSPLAATLAAP